MVRAIGETEYWALLVDSARKSKLSHALLSILLSSFFIALAGGTVLLFYPAPSEDWGYWIGIGIVLYAVAACLHRALFTVRLFRQATRGMQPAIQPTD